MPNFHRDELFLQHDLNGRNTIFFCIRQHWRAIHNAIHVHVGVELVDLGLLFENI